MSESEYTDMMEAKAYVTQSRLKTDLHGRLNRIVDEEMKEGLGGMTVSLKVTAALNEVLFDYIHEMGRDLEVFARHAGRKIINVSDVKMCARKNESLTKHLEKLMERHDVAQRKRGREPKAGSKGKEKVVAGTSASAKRARAADDDFE